MTNSETSLTPRWIGSYSDDPGMFLRLADREAVVLAYFASPHRTAIIAIRGESRDADAFVVLHGCKRIVAPISWIVRCLDVRREDSDTMVLSDRDCGVEVHFYAGRLFSRKDVTAYFAESTCVRPLIDDFHT